ncbi:AI-2E family transporter [Chloroflexus sp. MS-CIW-1]|uniref:AI-2E family transporter n=1 Tax=Chloroflexus sp. MS-CIW-1 TaxID=3055768 RepID=UPI002649ED07|nr:AI-2E family transporter [Chloroflexus sp. MS-CIW-1]MDN5271872.1 AI-2E family transporter [Chloroflexus sp. MS-CIW-1]
MNFLSPPLLRHIGRWLLIIVSLYLIGWLLVHAGSAVTPFIFGGVLAYLFLPLVNFFNRWLPRWLAILAVYLLTFGILVLAVALVIPPLIAQIADLIRSLPDIATIQREANRLLEEYEQLLASLPPAVQSEVQNAIASAASEGLSTLRANFVNYLQSIGQFLVNSVLSVVNTVTFLLGFFLIPFWLFYVLMDQRAGRDYLDRMIHPRLRADFWAMITIIDHDLSGYLRGQLILGTSVGLAAWIGLTALNIAGMKVPYTVLLAVVAGVTELVPVIGPIIGAIPAILLGLADSPTTALAVTILYIVIQQLENHILVPRIIGESVGVHPAVLMVVLVVCSQVFGLLGAILSAPLSAMARDLFFYLYGRLSDPPTPAGVLPERLRPLMTSAKTEATKAAEQPSSELPPHTADSSTE